MTPLSSEDFVNLLKNTGYVVYDYNIADQYVRGAGAFEELLGFTEQEFMASNVHWWTDHIHPDDRAVADAAHIKILSEGGPYHGRYRFKIKSGEYILLRDDGYAFAKDKETGLSTRMSGILSRIEQNTP